MTKTHVLQGDTAVSKLLELVAAVRRGDVVAVTIVVPDRHGKVTAEKVCEPNPSAFLSVG